MKFHQIEIEGFQSFRERQIIDFTGVSLAVATGPTGVGKSTMMTDAVSLCFYGKTRTATLEEVISTQAMFAQVVIIYELGGVLYKMERTVPRVGSQEACAYVADANEDSGWRAVTQRGVKENNAFIIQQLGTDYETATTTWLALQGDYGKFSQARPGDRYATLSGIFGLSEYAPLHAEANKQLASATSGVATAEARIEEIEKTLANKPDLEAGEFGAKSDEDLDAEAADETSKAEAIGAQIAELKVGDPARLRDELQATLTRIKSHRQGSLNQETKRLGDYESQLSRAEQSKASGDAALNRIAATGWDIETCTKQRGELADRLETLTETVRTEENAAATHTASTVTLTSEWNNLAERRQTALDKLEGLRKETTGNSAECFTCGQHLSEADTARLIADQEAELAAADTRMAQITEEGKAARAAATAAAKNADAVRTEAKSVQREMDQLGSNIGSMQALIDTKPDVEKAIEAAVADVLSYTAQVTEAKEAVASLQVPSEEETEVAAQFREAELSAQTAAAEVSERRAALQQDQSKHLQRVRVIDQEKMKRQSVRQQEAEMLTRLETIKDQRSLAAKGRKVFNVLSKAFSPAGIPAMILTGVVEEIGEEANRALETLSNGQLRVDIRASKETRSGGIQQKIVIYVDAPDGTRAYETFSGGQRFRIDLAIRAGLTTVISRRTGTPIETMIVDEGWGSLDESGVLSAVDTMERLSKELTVLTVSHIDTVKNAFPTVYEVAMDTGTSTVKRIQQ